MHQSDSDVFLVFSLGLSLGLIWKQIPILLSRRLHPIEISMIFAWLYQSSLRLLEAWFNLEDLKVDPILYRFIGISGITGDAVLVYILYVSMIRTAALVAFTKLSHFIKRIKFWVLGFALIVRVIRRYFIVWASEDRLIITNLQLSSLTLVLVILVCLDIHSYLELQKIFGQGKTKSIDKTKLVLRRMFVGLSIEILLSIVSLVITILESIPYQGWYPRYITEVLIGWVIASYIDQKEYLQTLFEPGNRLNFNEEINWDEI